MATKVISITADVISEEISDGDILIIRSRHLHGERGISMSVFPKGSATANVMFTHSPLSMVVDNPNDTEIVWNNWSLGDITSASTESESTLLGAVKAIRVKATGGSVKVQASYDDLV